MQLARERERIRALEDGMAKLRADSLATQQSLAGLQARLHQAESERYANPLVYGLAWLSASLALAVAMLWWRQSRRHDAAQWWAAPASVSTQSGESAAPRSDETAAHGRSPFAPLETPVHPTDAFDPSVSNDIEEPTLDAPTIDTPIIETAKPRTSPTSPVAIFPTAGAVTSVAAATASTSPPAEAVRELSVEELIDLEQQAEFFIVLGQDDAAIELLMSHVRSNRGISPLPYLKLLEIYRRRGEREAHERIRERFNRRFNAYAPDWDSDLQQGRSLVDYPETVARLQSLWALPARVMETLDASLFRRHRSDETFELPAYRELLFLYAVARDLAEHNAAIPKAGVDLLLPLAEAADEVPIARLSAASTRAFGRGDFQPSDMMTMPLDLDVSFDLGSASPQGRSTTASSNIASTTAFTTTSSKTAFSKNSPSPSAHGEVDTHGDTTPSALRRSVAKRPFSGDSDFLDLDLTAPDSPSAPGGLGGR